MCYLLEENYSLKDKLNKNQQFYLIGNYEGIELFVDALQRWTNNRIYLKKDDDIICEIEVVDEKNMLI
jgi:hypothetical protein